MGIFCNLGGQLETPGLVFLGLASKTSGLVNFYTVEKILRNIVVEYKSRMHDMSYMYYMVLNHFKHLIFFNFRRKEDTNVLPEGIYSGPC